MGRAALCALVLLLAAAAAEPLLDAPEPPTGPSGKSPAGRARETRPQRGALRAAEELEASSRESPAGQVTAQHPSYRIVPLDYIWVGIPAMGAAFICSFCVPYTVFHIRNWLRFRKLLRTLNDQLQLAQAELRPLATQDGTTVSQAVNLSGTCTIRISNEDLIASHTPDP